MSALSCLPDFIIYLSKYGFKIKTSDNQDRIEWYLFNKNNCEIRIKKINIDNKYILKWIYNSIEIKYITETSLKYFLSIYYEKDTQIIPFPKFDIVNNNNNITDTEFSYRIIKNKIKNNDYILSSEESTDETSIQGNICFFDILNKIVVQIDYDVDENNLKIIVQQNKTDHIKIVILHLLHSYHRQKVNIIYYKERNINNNNIKYLYNFIEFLNELNFQKKEEFFDGWRDKIIWENQL